MRVVYVTTQVPFGPQEPFILPEVRELQRQGHEVLMLPLRPERKEPVAPGFSAVSLPLFGLRTLGLALKEAVCRPGRVLPLLARMMAASGRGAILLKNLAVFPKALASAGYVRAWRPDHLHAHWASTPSTLAYLVAGLCEVPWSFTMHRWDIPENNMLAEKVRSARFARAINEKGLGEARGLVGAELAGKCRVLHMGVELPAATEPPAAPEEPPLLVCPANLVEKKGHRFLFEALAMLQAEGIPFTAWLIGEGRLAPELRAQAERLGLEAAVRFEGQWAHGDVLDLYRLRQVSAVVLPSITTPSGEEEGIPVSLMEAMAARVPVISTETGGIPELLSGGAGLLVPQQDSRALFEAIRQLLRSPELADRLREQGSLRVREAFALESVVRALVSEMKAPR